MFTADPWMLLPPPRPPHPAHVNLPRHNQVPYYVSTRHSNVQDFQDVQDFSLKNLSHLCVKIYRIQIPMAGYFNGENDDHPMDGSGHQGFTYWRHGISGRKIDHWTTHDPSTGWKCRKCYLIIIHGIKWNLEIEKPPNESSYHIISYHWSTFLIIHPKKPHQNLRSTSPTTIPHPTCQFPPPGVHGVRSRGTGAFDGHATLLFIRPGVGEARISRRLGADDASLADPDVGRTTVH